MTLPLMAFDPADGYKNKTEFPDPSTEDIGRASVQDIPDQLRDFLNDDFAPAIDKRTINAKTDNYTVVADDLNETITMTGTKTVTLPLITATGFGAGFRVRVSNVGSGTVTVAATSTDTIAGAASVSLAAGKSIEVVADAAGLWTVHGFDFTELVSTVSGNLTTHTAATSWTAPTLLNSWVNFGGAYETAGHVKDAHGFVQLKGLIKNGTATAGTTLFTLPVGSRPAATETFLVYNYNGTTNVGSIEITSAGNVNITGGTNQSLSLAGIKFKAA